MINSILFLEHLEKGNEETLNLKKELRFKDETIQQREIDISCLRGQVNALKLLYHPEKLVCNKSDKTNDDDESDSDTLTNIEPLSEEDIYLEDLVYDNQMPRMENISYNDKKDNNIQ